eukprot:TRINITY_DN11910_c0_g7_i1.p1 TRINITY_DN11910_c0_g7~~TRINITY_DN11910_c0_g7_i1.p1  ORF type:complete len:813 (-),score=50.79 TRINITY_DN11910_c0_g7_i1:238-2583(-)
MADLIELVKQQSFKPSTDVLLTFLADCGRSTRLISFAVVADVLGLAARPVALAYVFAPEKLTGLQVLLGDSWFVGLVFTISALLLCISISRLLDPTTFQAFLRGCAMFYVVDGIAQLPMLIWPPLHRVYPYPVSRTGLMVTFVQLLLGFPFATNSFNNNSDTTRLLLVCWAVPLRYMSLSLLEPDGPSAWMLYSISVICMVYALTPRAFWEMISLVLRKVAEGVSYFLSSMYAVIAYVWPKITVCVRAVLHHPILVGTYRYLILPIWERASPWFLPLAMFWVMCSCSLWAFHVYARHDPVISVIGHCFLLAAPALSFIILTLHTFCRQCQREQPDPLRWTCFLMLIWSTSAVVACPWRMFSSACRVVWRYILWPVLEVFGRSVFRLGEFAWKFPCLSIPCVLVANILLIVYVPGIASTIFTPVLTAASVVVQKLAEVVDAVKTDRVGDSAVAILLIALVQVGAYVGTANILDTLRVVRSERTGDVLSIEELNDIAVTMDDPRQCGRCAFGPVDHRGCSNLSTHHHEVSVRGGGRSQASNACPRCEWFTSSLHDWPRWDGELRTDRGCAMFRQRVWCEIVVVVRSSSKALLFPYALLKLGAWLGLPSWVSACLALSYLLPWTVENSQLFSSLNDPRPFMSSTRGRRADGVTGSYVAPADHSEADCGAVRAPILPSITESEALRNILTAVPNDVFLAEGDICSVCLEDFTKEACVAAHSSDVTAICQALRLLDPPVVALRCGHPLHTSCAEAAVKAGGARHVRCPLCREPVTLAGEASAAAFS